MIISRPELLTVFGKAKSQNSRWNLFKVVNLCEATFRALGTVRPIQLQQLLHGLLSNRNLKKRNTKRSQNCYVIS